MPLSVQQPDFGGLPGALQGWTLGQQWDMARQNNQMNQQAALQDMLYNQQMQPLNIQSKQLDMRKTIQDMFTTDLDQQQKQRELEIKQRIPVDTEVQSRMSEFAKNTSANELSKMISDLGQHMVDPQFSDEERAYFRKLYMGSMKIADIKAQQEAIAQRNSALEAQRQEGRVALAQYKAQAARALKQLAAEVTKTKDPSKFEAAMLQYNLAAANAEQRGDLEQAAFFRGLAEQTNQLKLNWLEFEAASRNAGKPMPIPTEKGGITLGTTPPPTRKPVPPLQEAPPPVTGNNPDVSPSSGSPANGRVKTLADLQTLYPGVPADILKQKYKEKYGIDLQ
jgi:hypothetical protein